MKLIGERMPSYYVAAAKLRIPFRFFAGNRAV
jgi:hypothetical protein